MAAHPTPASDDARSIWSVLNVILAILVGGFALFWGLVLFVGAIKESAGGKHDPDATVERSASPTAPPVAADAPNIGQQSPTTPAQVPAAPGQPPAVAGQAPAAGAETLATGTAATAPASPAGAAEITIKPDINNPLAYDTKEIRVKAGQPVKLIFNNVHPVVPQPHNVVIGNPGTKDTLMSAAMQMATSPDGMAKGFVPDSPDVLFHTRLLQPNESEVLEFTAPAAGEYPYLCTFPGHAILMNGVMKVE